MLGKLFSRSTLWGVVAGLASILSAATLPPIPEGKASLPWFDAKGESQRQITVHTYRPAGLELKTVPVVFVMHGVGRNGAEYRDSWVESADRYGFLVVQPEFSNAAWPGSILYNRGNVVDEGGRLVPRERWSYLAVEHLFDELKASQGIAAERYAIFGHSAGGQFVHRLALLVPEARFHTAVVGNSGWYTLPELRTDYPYGLKGTPATAADLRTVYGKRVVVLLGTADSDPNDPDLNREPESLRQGPHRLARGQHFFGRALEAAKAMGVPFRWELQFVPGVAHEYIKMAPAAAFEMFPAHGDVAVATTATPAVPLAWGLAVHGGAGLPPVAEVDAATAGLIRAGIARALRRGHEVLAAGGSALDAGVAAAKILEDNPQFNAGRGAVMTWEGGYELDASVMDGATRQAGAVAGLQHIANPAALARLVMERTPHVLLTGEGAEVFAAQQSIFFVPQAYFFTQNRWEQLQRRKSALAAVPPAAPTAADRASLRGTIGVVVRDQQGNLAAVTSTGGMTGKRWNRVGDSPIIGAGTYADNRTVAVSSTGSGEYYIRTSAARMVSARMELAGQTVAEAAQAALDDLASLGGDGGLIALSATGELAMPYNTDGMARGWVGPDGAPQVLLWAP